MADATKSPWWGRSCWCLDLHMPQHSVMTWESLWELTRKSRDAGSGQAPTSCTEKGALHDSNEGRSRFQGAFAEAVEIHVGSSDARLQGECMSETLLCQSETPHTQKSIFYFESIQFEPNKQAGICHLMFLPVPTPKVYRKKGALPSVKTSSLLLLLNPYVLQSKWTWDEANLTALFHQPSYPPIIVIFLECRNKTVTNSNSRIFTFH